MASSPDGIYPSDRGEVVAHVRTAHPAPAPEVVEAAGTDSHLTSLAFRNGGLALFPRANGSHDAWDDGAQHGKVEQEGKPRVRHGVHGLEAAEAVEAHLPVASLEEAEAGEMAPAEETGGEEAAVVDEVRGEGCAKADDDHDL